MTPLTSPNRRVWALRIILLTVFAFFVCIRMPEIVLKGRFWAEEGKFFFHNAWVMPPLQALLEPVGGYLNLVANAATLAARWLMPLRLAPYLTIAVALVFQLMPPLLLLTARDSWLQEGRIRLCGLLLLLLVPASEEIWLQTLHSQFELTLSCAIILTLETDSGRMPLSRRGFGQAGILLLAPLCGPGAIVLVPLFFMRAILDQSGSRLIQAFVLSVGSVIQLLLFFHAIPGRGYKLEPVSLLCVFAIRHLAVPFLGLPQAETVAGVVRASLSSGHLPWLAVLLPLLLFVPFSIATLGTRRTRPAFWLLAAGGFTALASYFGAIGGTIALIDVHFGERYVFVPQALFSLAFLAFAATGNAKLAGIARVAVLWLIVVGATNFFWTWPLISNGPSWRSEISKWQSDPTRFIELWPDGWTMTLEAPRTSK
ncbi:hypothetical protein HN018_08860 [Lichenicola cladoniae]|uniref:Uncharacterized protein n=1 Tax=Lichenicola cladoniae TaxID=1484109 RepID=A0A6M8HPE8_9PROT|nr:hypothetical protein [Lichenicola cladoniae]NPD68361.1 hypothetical protein [Acetobacteraceae bacterium]QKE90145.1 hypothetical protein HN018_08860 [Lichenicola cladoniae]